MRRRRILCDVDEVLAGFLVASFNILHRVTGTRYQATDLHDWDIFETVPRQYEEQFMEAWRVPGMCLSIPVIPGSLEGVKGLQERGDLYIVTSPFTSVPTWTHERDKWLERHFGIHPRQIVHTSAKYLVTGDVLIDDKPSNLQAWLEHHPEGIGILWAQPYNEKVKMGPRVHRAATWADVFAILDAAPPEDIFAAILEQDLSEKLTLDDLRAEAERQGIPGPDTKTHPEGYEGPCLCAECMSYGEG